MSRPAGDERKALKMVDDDGGTSYLTSLTSRGVKAATITELISDGYLTPVGGKNATRVKLTANGREALK